ncbi:MAG: hypothetical protein IKL86_01820 [Clostridia bacterium]|nr:hypothetical protein [Clostridia bacterium]
MKKPFILICIFVLVITLSLTLICCNSEEEKESLVWEEIILKDLLPKIESDDCWIITNNEDTLYVSLYDKTENDVEAYKLLCKEFGYNINIKEDEYTFEAFNQDGARLKMNYILNSLTIDLDINYKQDDSNDEPKEPEHTEEQAFAIACAEDVAEEFYGNGVDWVSPTYMQEYLIDVEGYELDIAKYAVEHANINWSKHVKRNITEILSYDGYTSVPCWISVGDVLDMLEEEWIDTIYYEDEYDAINWISQGQYFIESLSETYSFSNDYFNKNRAFEILFDQVYPDGFSYDELMSMINESDVDWEEHAIDRINYLWEENNTSDIQWSTQPEMLAHIKEQMSFEGFTDDEIKEAIEQAGIEPDCEYDYAFVKHTNNYDLYFLFDVDNNRYVYFGTNDTYVEEGSVVSADLELGEKVELVSDTTDDDGYHQYFKKNTENGTYYDYYGYSYTYTLYTSPWEVAVILAELKNS